MKKKIFPLLIVLILLFGCKKEKTVLKNNEPPLFSWGFSLEGFPIDEKMLGELTQETHIFPHFIQFYLQWPTSLNHFESIIPSLDIIVDHGAIPCMTWEPMMIIDGVEKMISFEEILKGDYDSYLIEMTEEIKRWINSRNDFQNQMLVIRFAHEMNLNRYHWGGTLEQFNENSPKQYIKAFRYIVTLFKEHQVDHLLWAFCPNVDSIPQESWNRASNYYPGDDVVDLLGMDGYNWNINQALANKKKQSWIKRWSSFEEIFNPLYQELKSIAPHKPIFVFETASPERNKKSDRRKKWINNAIKTAKRWDLSGIIWFQVNKEEYWRIDRNHDNEIISKIQSQTSNFSYKLKQPDYN